MMKQVVWSENKRGMKQLQKRYEESTKEVVVQKRDVYHFRFCFIPLLSFLYTSLVFVLYLFSIFFIPLFSWAAPIHPNAGKTAASFLKIGMGARPVAMGEAYVALADDAYAMYWNPAGLLWMNQSEMTASHSEWFQGIRHDFVAWGVPIEPGRHAMGIGGTMLYLGGLERRSGMGELPDEPPTVSEGTFGATDFSGYLSYALKLGDKWGAGITVKTIFSRIDTYQAFDVAADLGTLFFIDQDLSIGLAIQNLGPKLSFVSEAFWLPMNFKAGMAYRLMPSFIFAFDVNQPFDDFISVGIGAEYRCFDFLDLRAGYRGRFVGQEWGMWSGLTSGVGFRLGDLTMDYAFVPYGDLGLTHRISLSFKLGSIFSPPIPSGLPSPPVGEPEVPSHVLSEVEGGIEGGRVRGTEELIKNTEKEIAEAKEKLAHWGETLPSEERALIEREIKKKYQRLIQLRQQTPSKPPAALP